MPAPVPLDEEDRLAALASYDLLDTSPEPMFDHITSLAARIFQTPMAMVAFVDRERQWFKSQLGFGVCETKRNAAFCGYTILAPEPMVVPNAALDPRFADSPLVIGPPFVRFYAGAPIASATGQRVGTVCVLDTVPRQFNAEQIATLQELAALTSSELNARLTRLRNGARSIKPPASSQIDVQHAKETTRYSTALRDAEARYRNLVENAVEGIFQSTPEGILLSGNPALARLLGFPSTQAMMEGVNNLADLYTKPGRRVELERRIREEGTVVNFESQKRRQDGNSIWVAENIRAVRDATGQVIRYEGTVEDITARKVAEEALTLERENLEARVRDRTAELAQANENLRLEIVQREHAQDAARRSENKFRALLENAQDLITITDTRGIVLYSSPSIQYILGYGVEELLGLNAFDFIHPNDVAHVQRGVERVVNEGIAYERREHRFQHKDGSWRLLESVGTLTPPDSPIVGMVINSRDVTERRRAEQELAAHARQQEAMAELGRCALRGQGLTEMFKTTATLLTRALRLELSTICELLPGGEKLLVRASDGWPSDEVENLVVQNWRRAAKENDELSFDPLVVQNLHQNPQYNVIFPATLPQSPSSAISVLIQAGGQSFGTLCVLSTEPREFSRQEVTFLQTVADLLATGIERHRNEQALRVVEARYQRIVANTPGVVYQFVRRTDGSTYFPFISEGCRDMYGADPQAIYRDVQVVLGAVHPDDRASLSRSSAESAATLQPWHWEGRLLLPSGEQKWIRGDSRPERLLNGDIHWDGIFIDITQQRLTQKALREAKEEAERANNAKSEFLSRMSHELRTPLNAILGFGQLLQIEDFGALHNQSIEHILIAGRHLLDLVNEVLDMAQIDAGQAELQIEALDVRAAVGKAVELLMPLANPRGVQFEFLPPTVTHRVLADANRLNQLLLNLIANAIKFNAENGTVHFSSELLDDGWVRLTITDEGPGIAEADCARLFTPFERLNASQRGVDGVGIGLAISQRLVEAMRGAIGVDSSLGRGSSFYITLPAAPDLSDRNAAGSDDDASATTPPAEQKILLISGDAASAESVQRLFQTQPTRHLTVAADGGSGLNYAREHSPDLILFDLSVSDMDGAEALNRLRAHASTRSTPVLVLGAKTAPTGEQQLRRLGAVGFLEKPINGPLLLQSVDRALDAVIS